MNKISAVQTKPDVVVVGGGLAAMHAARVALQAGRSVLMICKKKIGRSGASALAMSVHRYPTSEAAEQEHFCRRLLAAGCGINDHGMVEVYVSQAARRMNVMNALPIAQRNYFKKRADGGQEPYLTSSPNRRGPELTVPFFELLQTQANFSCLEQTRVIQILHNGSRVSGVLALTAADELLQIDARSIVLATGGGAYAYAHTSCSSDLCGDGLILGSDLGLAVRDMEFVQFYPYRIYTPVVHDIFPDCFEHGARLLNEKGERFMADYPAKELENRDLLARVESHQAAVQLDLSQVDRTWMQQEYSALLKLWQQYPDQPFLIRPVSHFMMGGLVVGPNCSTALAGLFCCGEVTGGLHGANRLAGNALSETSVFGQIAGEAVVDWLRGQSRDRPSGEHSLIPLPDKGRQDLSDALSSLRQNMWQNAGIERQEQALSAMLLEINQRLEDLPLLRPYRLSQWFDYRSLLKTSRLIVRGALARKESRGAHFRSDFPDENPAFTGSFFQTEAAVDFKENRPV